MAIIIELKDYRIETAQAPYSRGYPRNLPIPGVWVVRKSDGAFHGIADEFAFPILWERAHGTPEEEIREWVQDWVEEHHVPYPDEWKQPAELVVG
jgi:hypothetical protein